MTRKDARGHAASPPGANPRKRSGGGESPLAWDALALKLREIWLPTICNEKADAAA
jgi:hypothetical protein